MRPAHHQFKQDTDGSFTFDTRILTDYGFVRLALTDRQKLKKSGKYFVTLNDSAAIAFVVGEGKIEESGFRLVAAHTDVPYLRIKPSPEMVVENAYLKLSTEIYGGSISDRVIIKDHDHAPKVKCIP